MMSRIARLSRIVALLAAPALLLAQQRAPFPHASHAKLFPTCLGCHAGIPSGDAATAIPSPAVCAACHDDSTMPRVDWKAPAPRGTGLLVFSHATHLGNANWRATSAWSAYGSYDIDLGNGASTSDGRAGMRWTASPDVSVGFEGSVTQTIYEYRIGTGRVVGAALNGAVRLTPDVRVVVDGGIYRQQLTNGAAGPDWSQRRVTLRLEWTVENDPGSTRGRAP